MASIGEPDACPHKLSNLPRANPSDVEPCALRCPAEAARALQELEFQHCAKARACRAGPRSAVAMLQESIAARSAVQPLLLSMAGRLELATAQLPRPAAAGSSAAAADRLGIAHVAAAVATGLDSDEDEPRAADALTDGVSAGQAVSSEEEDGDEPSSSASEDDSASDGSRSMHQDDSEDEQ